MRFLHSMKTRLACSGSGPVAAASTFTIQEGPSLRTITCRLLSDDPEDNNVVNAIFEDSAGFIWTGTDAGLNRFDPITGQLIHFRHDPLNPDSLSPGWVSAIYEDQDGRFWVGSQGGLDELDRATGRFIHYDDASADDFTLAIGAVMSIFQDRSGVLWLARHRSGLCKFDPDAGKCTSMPTIPMILSIPRT